MLNSENPGCIKLDETDMDKHTKTVSFENEGYLADDGEHRQSISQKSIQETTVPMPPQWDVFEETSGDNFTHNNPILERLCMILLKTLVNVFLFIFVLGTAIINRLVVLEMVQQLRLHANNRLPSHKNETVCNVKPVLQVRWIWAMFLVICLPYGVTFLKSLWKMIFKKTYSITISVLLWNILIETIHSLGLLMLIFIVLASIGPVRSSMLIYGIGLIPCILDLIPKRKKYIGGFDESTRLARCYRFASKVFIFAVTVFITALLISFHWSLKKDNTYPSIDPCKKYVYIIAPISLVLVSFKYWNLFSDRVCSSKLQRSMNKQKIKISLLISMLKIGYTLLFIYVFYGQSSKNCSNVLFVRGSSTNATNCGFSEVTLSFSGNKIEPFIYASVGMISGFLCFLFAKTACKLLSQKIAFALPLLLTGPISTILILLFTSEDLPFFKMVPRDAPLLSAGDKQEYLKHYFNFNYQRIVVIGFYLSFIFVTRHVWTPKVEKLAKEDKLFTQSAYCGVLLDQSILLSRRRDKKKRIRKWITEEPVGEMPTKNDMKMKKLKDIPLVYACATMWHENENEMMQLLKSIFRMDLDQAIRRYMRDNLGIEKDYYEFEAHIFFDDAFNYAVKGEEIYCINDYVKMFLKNFPRACKEVHEDIEMSTPKKIMTPYGGRLEWDMPGANKMVVHLKNKRLIRHKKRWSQVMYMYYFLGYRISAANVSDKVKETRFLNTFLLALDGDVDFEPSAVLLLIDRMVRNPKVGAACGRIHPIGTGPMVWYQKFEYAISHWLQKSTEHMIGCVLCSPGCFSLFRGSALCAENVLRRYTTIASEAKHKVQYDQGEDRWLCTLLLQQGFRVEYCAASDALTYCPETFIEFFKQRRRWAPSTMANILDLLMDWKNVRRKNDSISFLYIFYQSCLMASSILTPGAIFMLIVGAVHIAYGIPLLTSFILNLLPIVLIMVLCYAASEDVQLQFASVMSLLYAILMMSVLIGLVVEISTYLYCSTTTILFTFVAGTFIIAAILHPKEMTCLLHGILYFILIPAMSILLMFYALGNLQNVSWGTRDSKVEKEAKEKEAKMMASSKMKKQGNLSRLQSMFTTFSGKNDSTEAEHSVSCGRLCRCLCFLKEDKSHTADVLLEVLHGEEEKNEASSSSQDGDTKETSKEPQNENEPENVSTSYDSKNSKEWINDEDLKDMNKEDIEGTEQEFWHNMIKKYLPPEHLDSINEKKIKENLLVLRNHVCMFFCLINALFTIIVFTIEINNANTSSINTNFLCRESELGKKETNFITLVFVLVFGITLLVQLIAMIFHRYETFMHILASIDINPKSMNRLEIREFWAGLSENDQDQSDTESVMTDISGDTILSKPRSQKKFFKRKKPKKHSSIFEKMDKKFSNVYDDIHENSNVTTKGISLEAKNMSWMILLGDPEIKKKADIRRKWIRAKNEIKKEQLRQAGKKPEPLLGNVVDQVLGLKASGNSLKNLPHAENSTDQSSTTLYEDQPYLERIVNEPNWKLVSAVVHSKYSTYHGEDNQEKRELDQIDSGIALSRDPEADQNGSGWTTIQKKKKEIASLKQTPVTLIPLNKTDENESSMSSEHQSLSDSEPDSGGILTEDGTSPSAICEKNEQSTAL